MKQTLLLLLILFFAVDCLSQQPCSPSASIPGDQTRLGGGTATAHYSGTANISGGQLAYVKITNQNVLGVSYELTMSRGSQTLCTYKALLPSRTSVILEGSFFADPPVGWTVTVEAGSESDAAVLTFDVYSRQPRYTPVCAQVAEHQTAVLNCPGGKISSIQFASFGTPNGSCQKFSYGSCNSGRSMAVVTARCENVAGCAVQADGGVFGGDPCFGTVKRLYIQATCRQ